MVLTEKDYQVLDALDRYEITSQKQLADHAGISVGKVNYVLKSLLDRGLVKLGNFRRNPQKVLSYAYFLTPKGLEEKSRIAVRFVVGRLNEYDRLRQTLIDRLGAIRRDGHTSIIIVGPKVIREFLISILNEKYSTTNLIGQCDNWKNLQDIDPETYDVALIFDGSDDDIKSISSAAGIPKSKLMPLW